MSLEKLQSAVVYYQREVASSEGALAGAKEKQAKQAILADAVAADVEQAERELSASLARLQAADEAVAKAAAEAAEAADVAELDSAAPNASASAQNATVKVEGN